MIGEHTSAAAAYVAMTRGRQHNTAHIVADSVADARAQWIDGLRPRRRRPRAGACLVDGRPGHRPVRTIPRASKNAAAKAIWIQAGTRNASAVPGARPNVRTRRRSVTG